MSQTHAFVLPFRWREFSDWFSKAGEVGSENPNGHIKIADIHFRPGERGVAGIGIDVELQINHQLYPYVWLCPFLVDMKRIELFEPFIGNPDKQGLGAASAQAVVPAGKTESVELFIEEQGWILPSIWRFLFKSIGLKRKKDQALPHLMVLVFSNNSPKPLLCASEPFDYFGNAIRFQNELLVKEFMRILHLRPDCSQAEIQRAYAITCWEYKAKNASENEKRKFDSIKKGYKAWLESIRQSKFFCF